MLAFGPVPSRRFGRSLGVNNIPPKRCSYSCVYCQLGPTRPMRIRPRRFLPVRELVGAVRDRVAACRASGEPVDYVTVVPDGEPTLDLLLGSEIRALKQLGIPVAVITNGSLLWRPEVRAGLADADVVSVKVDTTDPRIWRRINRPGRQLRLPAILEGLQYFVRDFPGELWTETMLVEGINDDTDELERTAVFLGGLAAHRAYLAVPTRPPAVPGVRPPSTQALVEAHQIFSERLPEVQLLVSPEEGAFAHGDDPVRDLLAILQVHPMPERVARNYLREAGGGPAMLDELLAAERIVGVDFRGEEFVVARLEGVPRH
ncbi:MAG: radical SAM protein [Gemmatimonadetes bacterium]|nr:radical SAM protein [Gemmatimonadota bacterium]